jgi:phosphoribosylglycinamide formyltransferase-1
MSAAPAPPVPPAAKKRLAAFCSHGGSNFAAIADAAQRGEIPIEVVVMVHNNAQAGAKAKAIARGIPTEWVPGHAFADEDAHARRLLEILEGYRVDLVALAGFMQRIPTGIVRRYAGRMTNIHPALLPLFGGAGFYGQHVHEAVFAAGMKVSGPTVHLVDEEYDRGPILMQRAVPIHDCATPEEIAARVLVEEHRLYPETLGLLAQGRFRIEGRRATLLSL